MASPPHSVMHGGPRGVRPYTPIAAAGVVVLIVVLLFTIVFMAFRPAGRQAGTAGGQASKVTAPAVPGTVPAQPGTAPAQPSTAAPVPLAGFGSGPFAGGAPVVYQAVVSVRAAAHSGYDRFVIDFGKDAVPQYTVTTQGTPAFTTDPKGEAVTLQGTHGVLIVLRGARTDTAFNGSTDLHPGLPAIREARRTGYFEGVEQWALGVDGPGFVRVQTLTDTNRLVVDVQS